uniref:Uncharacterized protein n=1 Tax=Arundo donax TaxID=35708 RepID=A0A0A9ARZ6_ARUDO
MQTYTTSNQMTANITPSQLDSNKTRWITCC